MSNLNDIGLISATLIGGYVGMLYADRWIHNRVEIVATGLVRGVPVSVSHPWLMPFNAWFTLVFSIVMFAACISVVFVAIARSMTDPLLRVLADVGSVGFGGTAGETRWAFRDTI